MLVSHKDSNINHVSLETTYMLLEHLSFSGVVAHQRRGDNDTLYWNGDECTLSSPWVVSSGELHGEEPHRQLTCTPDGRSMVYTLHTAGLKISLMYIMLHSVCMSLSFNSNSACLWGLYVSHRSSDGERKSKIILQLQQQVSTSRIREPCGLMQSGRQHQAQKDRN